MKVSVERLATGPKGTDGGSNRKETGTMYLGYNTNGLAFHDPLDATRLLDEIGYRAVGLTIDHGLLSPKNTQWRRQAEQLAELLSSQGMRNVIETGARFLLNFRQKHEPTLMSFRSEDRDERVRFLQHAIDVARFLDSDAVSLWSGIPRDEVSWEAGLQRLGEGLYRVLDYADQQGVVLAFEPEPGMFIATMEQFRWLLDHLAAPQLRLTLDVGHLQCQGEFPLEDHIRRWSDLLVNVHLEDMRQGVHDHLPFGEGEIHFDSVLRAFAEINYQGGLYVELSRHSHEAPEIAGRAFQFLHPLLEKVSASP